MIVVPVVLQSQTPFWSGEIALLMSKVPDMVGGCGIPGDASATIEIAVGPLAATGVFGVEKNGG